MAQVQAVFWDVDGTLADTEMDGHRPAFNRAFRELGLDWYWDREVYQRLLAIPGGRQRMAFYGRDQGQDLSDSRLDRLRESKQRHYLDQIGSGAVTLRHGVARLIDELQRADVPQWIVTSSGQASVDALLKGLFGDEGHPFAGVVSSDDVNRHKPYPDPYHCALARSGASADACVALEDSAAGLVAATDASLRCVLTPSDWDQDLPSQLQRAVAVVDHLGDADHHLVQWSGPPCADGMVTLEYLDMLLTLSR
jgi:HAD superfamily hydrolase (TIGR01509 family)